MLGFFIKTGNDETGEVFAKYAWAFRKLFADKIETTEYSKDVELLLIEFTVEGVFVKYPKKDIRFISYRLKEKAASVEVGVKEDFINLSDQDKKEFIITSTLNSIELAKNVFIKKGLDISGIPNLLLDLEICIEKYKKMNIE